MRPLKNEVAGLSAGTQYEVYQAKDGTRRCAFLNGALRIGARVDGGGRLAHLTAVAPLYEAHVAALGCNPEERVPCGICGEEIAACLTFCPGCGEDPDSDVPCAACDQDGEGKPTGYINYVSRDGYGREELCFACGGSKVVDAPHAGEREAALAKARGWKLGQSMGANPVPAGIEGVYDR